jgi:ribonuclease E
MTREMIINAFVPENVRVAILEDGRLKSFFEEFLQDHRSRGNIYRGRIINIQPSLEACFVDYGAARHGFLPFSEIGAHAWARQPKNKSEARIERVMRTGQMLTVQVDKEATGTKGARLTTHLSLAGRFMVLMPYSDTRGVSRKIDDPEQRKQCRELADKLDPPKDTGLIVRTAGLGKNKRDLSRDLNYLIRLWKEIERRAAATELPALLHADADLIQRVLRDYYTGDIERVCIDDRVALEKAEQFFKLFMPRQRRPLEAFSGRAPIFSHFGIEQQLEEIYARRVSLPSGGSLVIDSTEALVAIDVNSGKLKGRNQEATAYETNLEAAREVARQLQLRDLGGIVVVDFIDMTNAGHKRAVERELRDAMRDDKARHRLGKISTFGVCTLTRQRLGKSVRALGHRECPACSGTGMVPDLDVSSVRLLRKIRAEAAHPEIGGLQVAASPELANHFQNRFRAELLAVEREMDVAIQVLAAADINGSAFQIEAERRSAGAAEPARPEPPAAETPAPAKSERRRRGRRSSRKRKSDKQEQQNDQAGKDQLAEQNEQSRQAKKDQPGRRAQQDQQNQQNQQDQQDEQPSNGSDSGNAARSKRRRRRRKKKKPDGTAAQNSGPQPEPQPAAADQPPAGREDRAAGQAGTADQEAPAPKKKKRRRRRPKKPAPVDLQSGEE